MREGCCNGERLQRRQQHHHQQASFSLIRRWPISQRHVKSASPPAESGGKMVLLNSQFSALSCGDFTVPSLLGIL
ncbi:hypothetical protein D5086_027827 [Populus alba]|uniref:Uncharacterized protein n=1 Tax=Populus alba TaxID=43335 RepID=A0ACC4AWI4_POPAL